MANGPYDYYRNSLVGNNATAPADWNGDVIKAGLLDTGAVTPNLATHDFWDDLVAGLVGTLVPLTISYPSAGKVDAVDFTFPSVTGASAEALEIIKSTGTNSTSPLLMHYDTFSAGMPVTPNGGDIAITVNPSGLATVG